jgi:hypothetical protein
MSRRSSRGTRLAALILGAAALVPIGLVIATHVYAPRLVARAIRKAADGRGLTASWRTIRFRPPAGVELTGLAFARGGADTTLRIDSLRVDVELGSLLALHPQPSRILGSGVLVSPRSLHSAAPDTLEPLARTNGRLRADQLPRIREAARRIARLICQTPERLPALALRDVTLGPDPDAEDEAETIHFDRLELAPGATGVHFEARGLTRLERDTPFVAMLDYGHDGAIRGRATFAYGEGPQDTLVFEIAARVERKSSPTRLRLAPQSRLTIGSLPFVMSGELGTAGPNLALTLEARDIRAEAIHRSVPPALLGPLDDVHVRGWFDYALAFNADLSRPDSLVFDADVTSHGLVLDPQATSLRLTGLDQPFVATIHLPRGRLTTRAMDASNPHFRTLDRIDSTLAHAVVTNEDGGFYRHHGFNTDAMKQAFAENLHAGGFRRGAGTITMQLARNLYLGHERTLSRKAQEVVLAWILEHLAGVSKRRLLELYLNIIEWGPGVHGADEAAEYYFDHDAGSLTVAEALFLATVVPAPSRWRGRFDASGVLRRYARAQMHFIGRAMINKGWLDPKDLPDSDELDVELRGPARDAVFPAAASMPGEGAAAAPAERHRR